LPTFTILSYNTKLLPGRGAAVAAGIGRAIRRFDVLCLQEVFGEAERFSLAASLRRTHPHRIEKADSGGWIGQDSGLFLASGFRIDAWRFVEWRAARGWDRWTDKGALLARLRVGRSKRLTVVNAHLQSDRRRVGESAYIRRVQLRQLARFVGRPRGATVLAGDFNVPGDTAEHAAMLRALGSPRDLFREACPADPGLTWDSTENPLIPRRDKDRLRLDYLLAYGRGAPRCRWIRVDPLGHRSDHFGVAAEIAL
jgi:endonuclease/exonuclease/phosphatase family metal-dependent hydrolase